MVATVLFVGLDSEAAVQAKVVDMLTTIVHDERTHREIATDPQFSLRLSLPKPLHKAIATVGAAQMWSPECLAAGLASNIGFLEHFRTRLSEKPNALHHVSPNIPVIIAASSSARKSSLVKYITSLLTSAAAPEEFRDRHIFLVDATLKGIRTSLVNYQRCAVNSDEAVNTYSTPWSEPAASAPKASRVEVA